MFSKVLLIALALPLFSFAQNTPDKNNCDQGDNTKLSLYVPGFLIKLSSHFVNEEKDPMAKEVLGKLRSVSICVREGDAYREFFSEKYDRKMQKLQKQNFEELLTEYDDDDKVSIQTNQNHKGKIRQIVLITDDGNEEFVFLRVRCNIAAEDLQRWIKSNPEIKNNIHDVVDL